ncbi:MAG: hypothetical protein AAF810_02475 [Cyanobacteria bacterium P01_D01_bin.36]
MATTQHYPVRSFIKFQVTAQLTADLTGQAMMTFVGRPGASPVNQMINPDPDARYEPLVEDEAEAVIDESLLGEIIPTALMAERHPELYRAYPTQQQAQQVESRIIDEIVETYKSIKLNQQNPEVTALNALL